MAENGRDILEQPKTTGDKDARIKLLKVRQDEERQKKLEDMKAQVLAAQRLKEQKEQERRRKIEDSRFKEDVRRQQVVERKRAIHEAERDRLESILKRNQEREARIELKKRNERSNIVFAFGSSTPRNLDPTDMSVSFWGHRRATSTQNITCTSSLTRRQSERDLDIGSKKRATSASGLERTGESSTPSTPAGCASGYLGRRRTDLVPTIPSRDASFTSSRKSLSHSPGRAYSMTRLDQLAKPRKRPTAADLPALTEPSSFTRPLSSSNRISSITRSMIHLAVSKTGPSPTSTRRALNKADSRSMHQLSATDGPLLLPRTTRASQLRQQKLNASSNCSDASSRPSSSLSQQSTNSVASSASVRHRPSNIRRPRPASIAITGVSHDAKNNPSDKSSDVSKPPLPRRRKSISKTQDKSKISISTATVKSPIDSQTNKSVADDISNLNNYNNNNNNAPAISLIDNKVEKDPGENETTIQAKPPDAMETVEESPMPQKPQLTNTKEIIEISNELKEVSVSDESKVPGIPQIEMSSEDTPVINNVLNNKDNEEIVVVNELIPEETLITSTTQMNTSISNLSVDNNKDNSTISSEMTASFSKPRITTEEEAKAALAERRRLAREEAERIAEQKRIQIEMEAQAEKERQQREEEQLRIIIEQQRAAEQERLEEAIRETQKREEEERLRREEEHRLKLQKEEQAREEAEKAEKQKAELQEKLKNEEKEREARRKRVEAIMSRTRGKNNTNSPPQQNSEDKNENKSESKLNGTKQGEQENGTTKNGKDLEIVDNIIPDETLKNANTVSIDTITSSDSLNSNNSWQATQQFDSLV